MSEYKPTVMPHDESLHKQKDHGGAPGLHVPENAENIDAFKNVRDVNAADLNTRLQAQDEAKKAHSSHGLQQFSHEVPHEPKRDASELNAALQAQDEARRNPHSATPGPVIPDSSIDAFKKHD